MITLILLLTYLQTPTIDPGSTIPALNDPDYCQGIACTEETDTCCDESL